VRFRTYKTVDARFVGSIVESGHFKEWVKSQAGGSAQPNANAQVLASFCFPLPPFDLQRRIASILGAYDDLIEVNRRRVAVLEAMARGLFEEWFVRFRFPGHENHKIIDTPNGPLPEGWTWGTFGALVNDIRDAVDPASVPTETRYVGLEHIPRRSTTLDSFGRADEVGSLKLRFQRGDVLFGKIRPYFHKVAWAPCDGVASSDAIVIRSRREEYAALALSVASSDAFVAQSVQASNGTKMPRANWRDMQSYRVPAAPLDTLTHFDGVALPMIELAASIQAASVVLAASRDLLLPRLISGELSVATAERELEAAA
jgi:type I restriction enzyme S subunit